MKKGRTRRSTELVSRPLRLEQALVELVGVFAQDDCVRIDANELVLDFSREVVDHGLIR